MIYLLLCVILNFTGYFSVYEYLHGSKLSLKHFKVSWEDMSAFEGAIGRQ